MSKRLNKRQQRELEELEQLKAQEQAATQDATGDVEEEEEDDEVEEDKADGSAPLNPFAAVCDIFVQHQNTNSSLVERGIKSKKRRTKRKKLQQPRPRRYAILSTRCQA